MNAALELIAIGDFSRTRELCAGFFFVVEHWNDIGCIVKGRMFLNTTGLSGSVII